ncbi:MAG TPA: HAD hydrolase-like protein, partial [Acetobacteraceae bacterium]|nr:HAD hydrolase-like protein [Acetobacteraceae bacterium]
MRRVGLLPSRPGGRRRGSPVPTRPDARPAALAGYRIVSCDIFDTALARRLARPADLHLATATRARAHRLTACAPEAFREYRLEAERVLRQDLAAHGYDEVRIAEIYDWLAACGVVTDAGAAAAIEFAVERSVCVAIEPVRQALAGLDPDQVLVFTSDTTLPGAWLADLLIACGYGPDPRVICSADTRCNKASGRLFASLLAQLGCRPEQVVHLGDDATADIARANEHGIRALYLPRPAVPPETDAVAGRHFALRLAHSHRRSRLARPVQPGGPALHHYGSILLIGFTLFVLAEARRRGIRRICFLARDGHIPLAIARRLIARSGEPFELSYLHVSRHLIVVPACSDDPDRLIEAIS